MWRPAERDNDVSLLVVSLLHLAWAVTVLHSAGETLNGLLGPQIFMSDIIPQTWRLGVNSQVFR